MTFIPDLAAHGARQFPDRTALIWRGEARSYAEQDREAGRLAATLRREGLVAGDRVVLLSDNHPAHVDLLLAAAKCGVVATPLNPRLGAREAGQLLSRADPRLVLFSAEAAPLAAAFDGRRVALADYDAWRCAEPLPPAAAPAMTPEALWMLLGTGGSTGTPKLAALPYRQIHANGAATVAAWDLRPDDVTLQVAPAFHAAVNVLATPLWRVGGCVVWQAGFEPGRWLADVARYGATLAFLVPSLYQQILAHPAFPTAALSSLRWALSGGAPFPPPVAGALAARGVPFRQGYGLTEAGVNVFSISLEEAARKPSAVGRPLPGIELRLRGANGETPGLNEPGELLLRGPQVFSGYFRAPEATAATVREGWLHTGDLAMIDEDGAYRICGRRKEMYISGGENVFPAEIEAELLALPGILEAAVVGVPDPRWGETGLAAVVTARDAGWTAETLAAALRQRLAPHQRPRHIRLVAALPKTATGKIHKPSLLPLHADAARSEPAPVAAADAQPRRESP